MKYDAIIIGSGANGLAAAIHLQRSGLNTSIIEQSKTPGGATKTQELTLPGFKHDVGSAIHPMAYASPFFNTMPLEKHGLEWVFPEIPFAHPFLDGDAFAAYPDVQKTASQLGNDEKAYVKLFSSITENWTKINRDLLGPIGFPKDPAQFIKFGLKALPSAKFLANHYFENEKTKQFFYGSAAHSTLPLSNLASSSFGLVLSVMAHKYGWPFPKGGSSNLIQALVKYYESLGGQIHFGKEVKSKKDLPDAKAYVFNLTPKQLLKIDNLNFSNSYRNRMSSYNYGAGIFKIDWALDEPIPFTNEKCRKAGTVHLGFSAEEMEESELASHQGRLPKKPYVLVAQHSIFDSTRSPEGKHTGWAYCHVPNGNQEDCTELIENQIERAAPGFKKTVLKRAVKNTRAMQDFDPNLIGGDINGGRQDITQLFTRPVASFDPYSTPDPSVFIASSSTPPGGGVHGMRGFHAAESVLKKLF